jgi:hypothetical protein
VRLEAIEASWLRDPVRLAISASTQVSEGQVQLTRQAAEQAARVPVEGLLEVLPGQELDDDALRLAMLVGIAFADPHSATFTDPAMDVARVTFT